MLKYSSQSHRVIIISASTIIFLLIIKRYYLSSEVSTEPTLFHVGCRPSPHPGLHRILSKPSRRNYPGPSLHFHDNNSCLLPLSRHIQIISFVPHKTKHNRAHTKHSICKPFVFYHHRSKPGYFHIIKTTCNFYYARID